MANNEIVPGFDDEKDDSLSIRLEKLDSIDGGLVLYLTGYIDTYNSNSFQKRVISAIESGYNKLVFSCAGLNYVSSTGIGSFTAFLKQVKPAGGDVVFLGIQPKVYEVFQLLGFSQFFNMKDTMESAIEYYRGGSGGIPSSETITRRPSASTQSSPGSSSGAATATARQTFPLIFSCPTCSKRLKTPKAGKFRCSNCKSIIVVDPAGSVSKG
jgi:anti-anti-sigma factor